jgi:stage V sporulation protein AD
MGKQIGKQSIAFDKAVYILANTEVVGKKEKDGPLGDYFQNLFDDQLLDKKTWEMTEAKMQEQVSNKVIELSGLSKDKIRYIFGGDLMAQLMATTFGIKDLEIPFYGVFGACSTFGASMQLASIMIDSGLADNAMAISSSHYSSAERQFRFPVEFGYQRPKSAAWTVTGAAAVILGSESGAVKITGMTTGKIVDYGIDDAMNMGGAMAPAAADTIVRHFKDFGTRPGDYDLIITGDLGVYGKEIACKLVNDEGYDISQNHMDCGVEIYSDKEQDTHAGGSGCGCSAVTFSAMIMNKFKIGELKKILFVPTGALLTTVSTNLKETIPAIAHALVIERNEVSK